MKSIENLVTIFFNVGEVVAFVRVISGLQQFEEFFKNHVQIRKVSGRYFYDILEFHRATLDVLNRPGFRKDAETRFTELSKKLDVQLQRDREKAAEDARNTVIEQRRSVFAILNFDVETAFEVHHRNNLSRRHSTSSGTWIFRDSRFRSWMAIPGVLYLAGMPGAGIIDHLICQKSSSLTSPLIPFFYFIHRDETKMSFCEDSAVAYVYGRCHSSVDVLTMKTERFLEETVKECLALILCTKTYIILDRLDECAIDHTSKTQASKIRERFQLSRDDEISVIGKVTEGSGDADLEECNFKKHRLDSCKTICSSLVEVIEEAIGPDSTVTLVHESAGRYLSHTNRVSIVGQHPYVADFCAKYLSSAPFELDLDDEEVHEIALTGYYGFQDYAVTFGTTMSKRSWAITIFVT
ncbi:hypothetical protein B0H63DRAFT_448263 [Podospora didyma]|uniref:Nephrocystin 3-like N-terminal domain-containing protein n=1 Tax=Podospora didyma TaxID=330526 RepID=A0AAE0NTG4_9PEZI|nr:hypothetical protein B0H63DRAFT_448263 [Podospora didyma]